MQVPRPADTLEQFPPAELGGDADHVGRLTATVEVADDAVDRAVGGAVEVTRGEHLDDVGDRVLGQQHAAQRTLLGGQIMRWGAVELD